MYILCVVMFNELSIPSPPLLGEISKFCSFDFPMEGSVFHVFSTLASSCRSCMIRTEVDASHTIYYSEESSASRVFYGGESRFDAPDYSLWYYSEFFFTNEGFFHYNKIFEQLRSRKYLQAFYSMSFFSYA